jgi:hypothetical protein
MSFERKLTQFVDGVVLIYFFKNSILCVQRGSKHLDFSRHPKTPSCRANSVKKKVAKQEIAKKIFCFSKKKLHLTERSEQQNKGNTSFEIQTNTAN